MLAASQLQSGDSGVETHPLPEPAESCWAARPPILVLFGLSVYPVLL